MSLKKALILGIALCGLLSYIFLVELPEEQKKANQDLLFKNFVKEQVESIKISNAKGTFTLKNTAPVSVAATKDATALTAVANDALKKWELAEIPGADLDRPNLNALLTALTGLRLDSALTTPQAESDLAKYGLDKPESTVTVSYGGNKTDIAFGKINTYVQKRYAKISGHPDLYLVSEGVFSAANKSSTEFRNKYPVDFIDSDLSKISLSSAGKKIVFEIETDKYGWRIVEPAKYRAGDAAMSSLTQELRSMTATDFLDGEHEKLAEHHLDQPDLIATLEFKENTKRTPLEVKVSTVTRSNESGEAKSETYFYVEGKPTVFKMTSNPVERIFKSVDSFREKKLYRFSTERVESADFTIKDGKAVSLKKKENEWLVNEKPGDNVFITELLRELSEIEAASFPSENKDFGFTVPALKVVVRVAAAGKTGSPEEKTLIVGDKAESVGYYAGVGDLAEPFIISADAFSKIVPKEEALLKRADAAAPVSEAVEPIEELPEGEE